VAFGGSLLIRGGDNCIAKICVTLISVGTIHFFFYRTMITDVQLAIFANALGVTLFLLVVLYHYISVNNIKKHD
jgi:hypothetical protein